MAYLLQAEYKTGSQGLWVKKSGKVYARYHAAYCGVVGLIEFPRHPPREPPEPSWLFCNRDTQYAEGV